MATVVTRLKVESQEFDNKIKSAAAGMEHLERTVRKMGGTFEYAEKEDLDFVRSLGQMETKAYGAKGKLKELTTAFTDLTAQYNRLTNKEKASPFGKEMAKSLDQLKGRIKTTTKDIDEATSKLDDLEDSADSLGGVFGELAGKLGIPTKQLTKMGLVIAAIGAALKGAKELFLDFFNSSEAMVDEWGRTVAGATSVYEGFLISINNSDFSGFLSNIGDIIDAARDAYDELDRLRTMQIIQTPEVGHQEAENRRNRAMLQTRRYIAPLDGSEGFAGMETGDLLSDEQMSRIEEELKAGISKISTLIENEVVQTNKAIDAEYNRFAETLDMSAEDFRKGTSSMAEFDKMLEYAKKYSDFEREHTTHVSMPTSAGVYYSESRDSVPNPYEQYRGWDIFRVDGDQYKALVELIEKRDALMTRVYANQAEQYQSINSVNGITPREGDPAKIKTAAEMWEELQKKIKEAEQRLAEFQAIAGNTTLSEDQRNWAKGMVETTEKELNKLKGITEKSSSTSTVKTAAEMWDELQKKIKEAEQRLAEFQAIAGNTTLGKDQRDWAKGMVDKYEDELKRLRGITEDITIRFNEEGIQQLRTQINESLAQSTFGSQDYIIAAKNLADLDTFKLLLSTALQNGLNIDMTYLSGLFDSIKLGLDIEDSTWDALVDNINEQLKKLGIDPITIGLKAEIQGEGSEEAASNTADAWKEAANAVNSLGGALQNIEDPSAKVAGIVMQAIANIALGFAQAAASPATGAAGVFGWIAAATAGLATMTATIASIKSVTSGSYASGGIIPGNSFSGDNQIASVNAGELILNRSQQSNLANQLSADGLGNLQLEALISGESLRMVLANNASRRGGNRAQYAISNFR